MDGSEQKKLVAKSGLPAPTTRGKEVLAPRSGPVALAPFFQTVVYRDFAFFCEQCRRSRSIGVVYGASGVGKTLAARAYTQWDRIAACFTPEGIMLPAVAPMGLRWRGALYTLEKGVSPKQLESGVGMLQWSIRELARTVRQQEVWSEMEDEEDVGADPWQLLLLDSAQFLDASLLDVVQSLYDRYRIGVVLLGPPSLVESHAFSRHAHLKTRIGRYYGFRLLSQAEIAPLVAHVVSCAKLTVTSKSGEGAWLVATIHVMTRGNVSLVELLLDQVVELLQGEKTPRLTEAVLQKAYHNLRWS